MSAVALLVIAAVLLVLVVISEVISGHIWSDATSYFSEDSMTTDDFADRATLDLGLSNAEDREYLRERFAAVARRAAAAERSRCLSHLEQRMGSDTASCTCGRDINEALCAVHEVIRGGH